MNRFKITLITLVASICLTAAAIGQQKLLKKSWIKTSIEELRQNTSGPDTSYLRYEFGNSVILYGFEPGWHSFAMAFHAKGNALTLGFDQWTIETLTDSTLTIFLPGFRRMKFSAEDHLRARVQDLVQIGEYNGKPVFKATQIITPRYKKHNPLIDDLRKQDRSGDYNIRKAGIFQMSFIVTDEGKIEEPKIIKSVAPGYDAGIIKELLKTSRHWSPAMFKGQPIQTLMMFEIIFLDSLEQN
jgi:hypothetical protein